MERGNRKAVLLLLTLSAKTLARVSIYVCDFSTGLCTRWKEASSSYCYGESVALASAKRLQHHQPPFLEEWRQGYLPLHFIQEKVAGKELTSYTDTRLRLMLFPTLYTFAPALSTSCLCDSKIVARSSRLCVSRAVRVNRTKKGPSEGG